MEPLPQDPVRETPLPQKAERLNRAFGPVAAGLLLDMLDLATFGPIGLFIGLPVGALMGYWMGQSLGLEPKARGWCALAGGVYCLVPGTEFLPLATLLGAYVRYRSSAPKRPEAMADQGENSEPTPRTKRHNGID